MSEAADGPREFALLDLGSGRQLARCGALIVDRPFPAATEPPRDPAAWSAVDLRYDRPRFGGDGRWTVMTEAGLATAWPMLHDGLVFEARPTPSGQVGFFPEQAEPWQWIRSVLAAPRTADAAPPEVLNLFAHTGGSTLVAAASGGRVTHVDGARPAVAWARRNAALSGLADAPIRWIVDDALGFVEREARRGREYEGLILDPPSYGHGPRGERWTLEDRLPELLDACLALMPQPRFILLTAHEEGLEAAAMGALLAAAFDGAGQRAAADQIEAAQLALTGKSGATAPAGVSARWAAPR